MRQHKHPSEFRSFRHMLAAAAVMLLLGALIATTQCALGAEPSTAAETRRLLAKADADLRKGLLRLTEDFPQLKNTNSGTIAKELKGDSDAGTVTISVGHYSGFKGGSDAPVAKVDTYTVVVVLRPAPAPDAAPAVAVQIPDEAIYTGLGLVGRIHVSAGDEKLNAALKKLVDEALAPLAKLDKKAAAAAAAPPH